MSSLTNIMKKELKEILTPATIVPIIFMAILFGSLGNAIGGIQDQMQQQPAIGFINEDTGHFSDLVSSIINNRSDVVFDSTNISDKQNALTIINKENGLALIYIPKNFSENILNDKPGNIEVYWIMKGAGILDSVSSEAVNYILSSINRGISESLIAHNSTVNATIALNPSHQIDTTYFKHQEFTGLSPSAIVGILSSQSTLIPLIILMIIMMSGGTVITSMALEKENKTLETLLTLPVKRVNIVIGKISASALVGLLLAVIYMFGLGYYMQSFQFGGSLPATGLNLTLSNTDLILMGILLFVTLLSALALCMLLGTMAKNFKSAQTLTFPIVLMALFPYLITMFKDFDTLPTSIQAVLFAIPFSHPMMATRALIFHDYTFVIAGIIYVTAFAAVTISIVVWIFKTDKLLTGSSIARRFMKMRRRKGKTEENV
jgi:ABC-2 type transport system permease protein